MQKNKYRRVLFSINMVLPFVDEDKPKCYLCHEGFENINELKKHQQSIHKEFFEFHEKDLKRGSVLGDVTVF